jgi:hypothetical protein
MSVRVLRYPIRTSYINSLFLSTFPLPISVTDAGNNISEFESSRVSSARPYDKRIILKNEYVASIE